MIVEKQREHLNLMFCLSVNIRVGCLLCFLVEFVHKCISINRNGLIREICYICCQGLPWINVSLTNFGGGLDYLYIVNCELGLF